MGEKNHKARVLIVGYGTMGRMHTRTLQAIDVPNLAVCDPDERNRQTLQAAFGVQEGYSSLIEALKHAFAAVFICTPPALHIPQARLAIEARCDVFMEKPLSDSLEGVNEFINLAEQCGRSLMVGMPLRFHPGLRQVKQLIDSGAIGRLISARAMLGVYLPEGRRIGDLQEGFGVFGDVGLLTKVMELS